MARAELQQTAVEPAGSKKICIRGCSRLNKLLHSPAFQMEIVGCKQIRQLRQTFALMAGDPQATSVTLLSFRHFLDDQPHLCPLSQGLFGRLDHRQVGFFTFEDLLHIVYPGASPAQIRDLSGLAEPDAKVIIEREQAVARRMLNIAQAFAACDTDGSGALDLVEFIEAMADIAGYEEQEARAMFKAADTDGSGLIELEEFLAWFRREESRQSGGQKPSQAETDAVLDDEDSDVKLDHDLSEEILAANLGYDSDDST